MEESESLIPLKGPEYKYGLVMNEYVPGVGIQWYLVKDLADAAAVQKIITELRDVNPSVQLNVVTYRESDLTANELAAQSVQIVFGHGTFGPDIGETLLSPISYIK